MIKENINFLKKLEEYGILKEKIWKEKIDSKDKFIDFVNKETDEFQAKEILSFATISNVNIKFFLREVFSLLENNENNDFKLDIIKNEIEKINEKIDDLKNSGITHEKIKDVFNTDKIEKLNLEVEKTTKFLIDLRTEVNKEVESYTATIMTSTEESFNNLSRIMMDLAEKFVCLRGTLENPIASDNNQNEKKSLKLNITLIVIFLFLLIGFILFKKGVKL